MGDYTQPHPFYPDEIDQNTGLYKLGCPELFYIVADDQLENPKDDDGLKEHRENIQNWEYTKQKLTDSGYTDAKPIKLNSDSLDAERMIHARSWGYAKPRTRQEEFEHHLRHNRPNLTPETIEAMPDGREKAQKIISVMMEREMYEEENRNQYYESAPYTDYCRAIGLYENNSKW